MSVHPDIPTLQAAGYDVRAWVRGDFPGGETGDFVLIKPDGRQVLARTEESLWSFARRCWRLDKIKLPNPEREMKNV